jgi:cell shape-determining protein MreC
VENIQQDDAIDIGDQVITSGVNGLFVPGILVGTVVEINASPADLYKTARLEILDSEFTGTLFVLGL